ncbi:hypothetical protein GMD78_12210 [Ornithinibacillus sp. L9]|uniref:Uncharacterized protein n=1 Tax=Ornithinibacillus caprae TaxID=2678566 RepID=A0A6N8FMA9_9BACI|nr:hypothetical protein [Ornithinibacillus caprae]MUK89137.1 hypothetical protein [Ornithinibacillus caprae]
MNELLIVEPQCNGFWRCITPDAWLTSFGTLVGALIGASLGSLGSYLFFKARLKEEEKQVKGGFYKEFKRVSRLLDLTIERMEIVYKNWGTEYRLNWKSIDTALLGRVREDINNIPKSIIPMQCFDNLEIIEHELGGMEGIIELFVDLTEPRIGISSELKDQFYESLVIVKKNYKELKEINSSTS